MKNQKQKSKIIKEETHSTHKEDFEKVIELSLQVCPPKKKKKKKD